MNKEHLAAPGGQAVPDRELLERAARAAGMEGCVVDYDDRTVFLEDGRPASVEWNPLTDDGDAFRLAVKLGAVVGCFHSLGYSSVSIPFADNRDEAYQHEYHFDHADHAAATRRAIVVAAAALPSPTKELA